MHLAVISYEPKQRLILATPKHLRIVGGLLVILAIGMVLVIPFGFGAFWLLAHIEGYTTTEEVISAIRGLELHWIVVLAIVLAITVPIPYFVFMGALVLLGVWAVRRRREIEIDCSRGMVIERQRFLRGDHEDQFPVDGITKAVCISRMKSSGNAKLGGSVTSFAVNLVFQDGSIVNFESLDSRLPAMIEQIVPQVQTV